MLKRERGRREKDRRREGEKEREGERGRESESVNDKTENGYLVVVYTQTNIYFQYIIHDK